MTPLDMAALPGLAMAALAGCLPTGLGPDRPAAHVDSAEPSRVAYAPNPTARRTIGRVVTTRPGAAMHIFDEDQNDQSSCYDDCASQWPPLIAMIDAKPYWRASLATSADGRRQWAYDGKPLYAHVGDTVLGDINGDNVGNFWHVVR